MKEIMSNRSIQEIDMTDNVFRFDLVYTILALAGTALIGWAMSIIPDTQKIQTLVFILSGISSAIYLLCYANLGNTRSATVIKYLAWTTLVISNFILALMSVWCENATYFRLVIAVIVLGFTTIAYGLGRTKQ